jgi:septum formation protein
VPHSSPVSPDPPPLVLASGSVYRKQLLDEAGIAVTVDPPDIDERVLDDDFAALGAEGVALELARRKAAVVAARHPGSAVIAGDQVGVLERGDAPALMLTKQPDTEAAVAQLMALSGTTHRLVNGLVVLAPDGRTAEGVDVQEVTMRPFTRSEATAYVGAFEPWDTSGSYRLEDQDRMGSGEGFVTAVRGEDRSGVLGLPVPLLRRLLASLRPEAPPADR